MSLEPDCRSVARAVFLADVVATPDEPARGNAQRYGVGIMEQLRKLRSIVALRQ